MKKILLYLFLSLHISNPAIAENEIETEQRKYKANLDKIFIDIGSRNVSQQSLQELEQHISRLNSTDQDHFRHFFQLFGILNDSFKKNPQSTINNLEDSLTSLGINPAVRAYFIYSVYRDFAKPGDEGYFQYLKKSAGEGLDIAIWEWTEYQLDFAPLISLEEIQDCITFLKGLDDYENNNLAMIFLSRITIIYQYQKLTGLSTNDALECIFNNRGYIESSARNFRSFLEAGMIYLSRKGNIEYKEKGLKLLQKYIPACNDIGTLLKFVYISEKMPEDMDGLSKLSTDRIHQLIINNDQEMRGSTFLAQQGWKEPSVFLRLNHGEDFVTICLERLREEQKGKPFHIKNLFFNISRKK